MRAFRASVAVAVAATAACQQIFGLDKPTVVASGDAGSADAAVDATPCTLQCAWSCIASPTPHCARLVPSGGGVTPQAASDFTGLVVLDGGSDLLFFNSDGGAIADTVATLRGSGSGVIAGIDFEVINNVGIWRFSKLTLAQAFMSGSHPIALVADQAIEIDDKVYLGTCGTTGTLGGYVGGTKASGAGAGGGGGTSASNVGGGGGGYGGAGGDGGNNAASAGAIFGDPGITLLIGGGGGGGGGGGTYAGAGGNGGAGIQLVSNERVLISVNGGVNAGGCGGHNGSAGFDAGGGGGAGGTILIEAPVIAIDGALTVNGGGGGAGSAGNIGAAPTGGLDRTPAAGGTGTTSGGTGGAGGTPDGGAGSNSSGKAGGGGGAVGRIRLNTRDGNATIGSTALLSPNLTDPATTCTQGSAAQQ